MVERHLSDGKRIAQLLASELDGLGGRLSGVSLADADPAVEPTVAGSFAYAVVVDGSEEADSVADVSRGTNRVADASRGPNRIAEVYVQPERARIEFRADQELARAEASKRGLRVRPKATQPPRTLVFLEDGADVKRAVSVVAAVVDDQPRTE